MKIIFIIGSLNQGGAEYQILLLAKLFQEKGHDVKLFAITDYSFYRSFVEDNNLQYSHLLNHQSPIKRIFLTTKMVRKEKPDLIISYLKAVSQVALFAKIFSGRKTKIIVGERTADIQPLRDKFHFNFMRLANFITVNSVAKLNYLKNRFPSLEKKTIFFHNIMDLEKYKFIDKTYDSKILKIGYVGRISPEKNIINLIEAIKILKENKKAVELLIFGASKNVEYLKIVEDYIHKNSLNNMVTLKGETNNMLKAYKEIELLCLVSNFEGFSNVLSEGLACGIPIITSDIEENKFLIEHKVNGFVVNHKDPKEIAHGIINFLNLSVEAKKEMAKNNRRKAEKIFNSEVVYQGYMKLIDQVILNKVT